MSYYLLDIDISLAIICLVLDLCANSVTPLRKQTWPPNFLERNISPTLESKHNLRYHDAAKKMTLVTTGEDLEIMLSPVNSIAYAVN